MSYELFEDPSFRTHLDNDCQITYYLIILRLISNTVQKMRKKPLATFSVDPFPAFRPPTHSQNPHYNQLPSPASPICSNNEPGRPEYRLHYNKLAQQEREDELSGNHYRKLGSKAGQEMSKLSETINQFASRPKVYVSPSKENLTPSRLNTPVSQMLSSSTSLPRLDRPLNEVRDQSKLMEEIRRVENRIKQLKFERTESSNAQKSFDMIRPFLQIQNQNMVNLQMMILAQNNKPNYGHHCCSHERAPYPPYPMPYAVREANESDSDTSQEFQHKISKKKNKKRQILGKKDTRGQTGKKYNLSKLRKFRVAAIAVYFALLFPKYSNKFTLRRHRLHAKEFYTPNHKPQAVVAAFVEEMISLNSIKIAMDVRAIRMDKTQRRVAKTAKLIITQQYEGKKNFEFYIGDVQLFLLQFLKKMQEIVEQGGLDATIKYIGCGNLPLSFPIDNYHLLQQIYRINFDPQKTYLKITPQVSKALIISGLFIKFLIFGYFFLIKDNFDLKKKLQNQNKIKNDQMIEVELASTEMYFSGIVLHQYCMDLLQQVLDSENGNGDKIASGNLPIPRKTLIFSHFGEIEKALGANVENKPLKRNSVTSSTSEVQVEYELLDIQQHEEQSVYEFAYIKNLEHFDELLSMVKKTSDYETEIKDKVMDIVDLVVQRITNFRKEDYKNIKREMLFEEKNILKHRINIEELKMPKRNAKEKQFLKAVAKLITANKQNELQSAQENSEQESEEWQKEQPPKGKAKGNNKRAAQSYNFSSGSQD